MDLRLRGISPDDGRLLWEWRNDALVRANSFTQDVISWESHCAWLAAKLASPDSRIWILETDGRPAGQIRYDRAGDAAELSYLVAEPFRGAGLGAHLLRMSGPLGCRELAVSKLVGIVKSGNVASVRSFERAGFRCVDTVERHHYHCLQFEKDCAAYSNGPRPEEAHP